MANTQLFGDLRSFLQTTKRTPMAWETLCRILETFEPEMYEAEVESYVEQHLSSWPDIQRVAPLRWLRSTVRGQNVPWLSHVRHMTLSNGALRSISMGSGETADHWVDTLGRLEELEILETLTHLTVLDCWSHWSQKMPGMFWKHLFETPRYANIKHFGMSSTSTHPIHFTRFLRFESEDEAQDLSEMMADSPLTSGLDTLILENVNAPDEQLFKILSHPCFQSLKKLECTNRHTKTAWDPLRGFLRQAPPDLESFAYRWQNNSYSTSSIERLGADFVPKLKNLKLIIDEAHQPLSPAKSIEYWFDIIATHDLETLELHTSGFCDGDFEVLLEALDGKESLTKLAFCGLDLSDAEVEKFYERSWPNLEHLAFTGTSLKKRKGKLFFQELDAPSLRSLDVQNAELNARACIGIDRFDHLESLRVDGKNKPGQDGFAHIFKISGIKSLNLERTIMTDEIMQEFIRSSCIRDVEFLNLMSNRLSEEAFEIFFDTTEETRNIRRLFMGINGMGNTVNHGVLEALAGWENAENLEVLSLISARCSAPQLTPLLQAETFENLRVLDLSGNTLDEERMELLVQNQSFRNLEVLGLSITNLNSACIEILFTGQNLKNLKTLAIQNPDTLRTADFDFMLEHILEAMPKLEWLDAASDLLNFAQRRRTHDFTFSTTNAIAFRGISDFAHTPAFFVPAYG